MNRSIALSMVIIVSDQKQLTKGAAMQVTFPQTCYTFSSGMNQSKLASIGAGGCREPGWYEVFCTGARSHIANVWCILCFTRPSVLRLAEE